MALVWYILISVSLGMLGFQWFTFTNTGALYCAAATAIIQAWPVWEIHRVAWPRFQAGKDAVGTIAHAEERNAYWWRLGRLYFLRICIFTILSLIVASLFRGE